MKVLILKILSILLKVVIKLVSDEELTRLIEDLIRADLNGDGLIGDEKEYPKDTTFQTKSENSVETNSQDSITNTSNNFDNTNNISNTQKDLSNLNTSLLKRDVDTKLRGGLL